MYMFSESKFFIKIPRCLGESSVATGIPLTNSGGDHCSDTWLVIACLVISRLNLNFH